MIDNKNAQNSLSESVAEQTCNFLCKHVIQASTASSHRVGKCLFEPSKQSRIRRSSFWSHRRSTVQWETALSSKERSRRVNCPMIAPLLDVPFCFTERTFHLLWKCGFYRCGICCCLDNRNETFVNAFHIGLDLFFQFSFSLSLFFLNVFLSCFTMAFTLNEHGLTIGKERIFFLSSLSRWSDPFIEAVTSCNFWVCLKNGCVDTVTSWFVTPPNMCSFGMRWI